MFALPQIQLPDDTHITTPKVIMADLHTHSSGIEALPGELLTMIYCSLPDIKSLQAAAVCTRFFNNVFLIQTHLIVNCVLHNEISPGLFPKAITAVSAEIFASELMTATRLREFLASDIVEEPPQSAFWTLARGLAMSHIHQACVFFAHTFAEQALSGKAVKSGTPGVDFIGERASTSELDRLCAAFYRFETCCSLLRMQAWEDKEERKLNYHYPDPPYHDIFHYSTLPWLDEQLVTVYDFLLRHLSIAWDEAALHDVEWGERQVDVGPWQYWVVYHYWKEVTVSRGISFLHDVARASSLHERKALLGSPGQGDRMFLVEAVQTRYFPNRQLLEQYYADPDSSEVTALAKLDDVDPGPRTAWRWGHGGIVPEYDECDHHYGLRASGYCFWDLERLEKSGFLDKDIGKLPHRTLDDFKTIDALYATEHRREYRRTWEKRARIWRKGGSGWWGPGDESRIVWADLPDKPKKPDGGYWWTLDDFDSDGYETF